MSRYKLINGDCISTLQQMPDKSIDLLLTDPPYNISQKNNFNTMKNPRVGLDFGEWDKGFDVIGWIKTACDKVRNGGGYSHL